MVEAYEQKPIREIDQLTNLAGELFLTSPHSSEYPYFLLTASQEALAILYPPDKQLSERFPWDLLRDAGIDPWQSQAFRQLNEYDDMDDFFREFCSEIVSEVLTENPDLDIENEERIEDFRRNW